MKYLPSYFQDGRQCHSVSSIAEGYTTIVFFSPVPLALA